jgi:dipeptidase E
MTELFLSGGGNAEQSSQLDFEFSKLIDKSKPLLYIPIAIDPKKHPYPSCLKWIKDCLYKFGIKNIVMWTEEGLKKAGESDFKKFSGVYIGGGNTFKLLKDLKEFGTLDILKKLAKKNVPLYGGSAGAIIMGFSILSASSEDKNEVSLKNFEAFNFVEGYDIRPHYKPSMDKDILRYQTENNRKIIALPEDSGLYVSKKGMKVIGPGSAFIFYEIKREIKPGEYVT